jgi:hypothetical protein
VLTTKLQLRVEVEPRHRQLRPTTFYPPSPLSDVGPPVQRLSTLRWH